MKYATAFLIVFALSQPMRAQKLVRYDLTVTDTVINYTGKSKKAIAVNGQIPMPTLYFQEGDTAEIYVHNKMHHETSVHWHGLLLPNEQDGVPYLTTAPVKSQSTHKYKFVIRQSGTYWYHSHTMLQEQIGMNGAIVIYAKNKLPRNEEVVLLSDWSDENPHQIERSLHFATDWYMIRKNAVQSYGEAMRQGMTGAKFENEWKRMHAMDVSDVYYERFLVNGQTQIVKPAYSKGDTVRLRVINGSSSTYFWLNYAGGKMRVVASDGIDVVPVMVDRLIVGVSEIYDIEVIIPDSGKAYQFTATSEDRMGAATVWFGSGHAVSVPKMPLLDYFQGMQMMNDMMYLNGRMNDMGMEMALQKMDMNAVMYKEAIDTLVILNYNMLRSPDKTTLPDVPFRELHFELTGNMNRYVWTVDNKTISESDMIRIKSGENIRIILRNNSMMRHPMHLHGHFFRVVNQYGDYSPLKNVLDIMPMETDTIEFHASEAYGDWYFHCHILYHMMSGMGRIFTYENSPPNPQIPDRKNALKKVYADDRRFYPGAEIGLESNGSDGEINYMNTRWRFSMEWRLGLSTTAGYETESHFGRFIDRNQFLFVYTGWDWRYRENDPGEKNIFNQLSTKNNRGVVHFGIQYTMPWFIVADASIDHTGYFRMQFRREDVALTRRLRAWGMWNTDQEYVFGLRFIFTKYFALSTHYDSDNGYGAGITIIY